MSENETGKIESSGSQPSSGRRSLSAPHYFKGKAFDVMKGMLVDLRGECDSQICPYHIPENMGKFLPKHPDTNYALRGQKPVCRECGGPLVYDETEDLCARCQVMNDAQDSPEWAR